MIVKARNKRPRISFDLGKSEAETTIGNGVKIHLLEVFNSEFYSTAINPISGLTISKQNINTFLITPTSSASYQIRLEVTNDVTGQTLISNTLTLIAT